MVKISPQAIGSEHIIDGAIGDADIAAHTSTKITITAKGQLNSQIAYRDTNGQDWATNTQINIGSTTFGGTGLNQVGSISLNGTNVRLTHNALQARLIIEGATASEIHLADLGGAANAKQFRFMADGDTLLLSAASDDYSLINHLITFTHGAGTPAMNFHNRAVSNLKLGSNMDANGQTIVGIANIAKGSNIATTNSIEFDAFGRDLYISARRNDGVNFGTINFQTHDSLDVAKLRLKINNGDIGTAGITYYENLEPSGNVSLVAKVKAGTFSDADFDKDTDGLLAVDSTNGRLYLRYGGVWHYITVTA